MTFSLAALMAVTHTAVGVATYLYGHRAAIKALAAAADTLGHGAVVMLGKLRRIAGGKS